MDDASLIKMMFGEHAKKIPCWLKTQKSIEGITFVGASRVPELYTTSKEHLLIIGEIIIRPHIVIGSNHCIGHGLAGLAKEFDTEAWSKGDIIASPMGLRLNEHGQLVK